MHIDSIQNGIVIDHIASHCSRQHTAILAVNLLQGIGVAGGCECSKLLLVDVASARHLLRFVMMRGTLIEQFGRDEVFSGKFATRSLSAAEVKFHRFVA